jgi:hypothetical protein
MKVVSMLLAAAAILMLATCFAADDYCNKRKPGAHTPAYCGIGGKQ